MQMYGKQQNLKDFPEKSCIVWVGHSMPPVLVPPNISFLISNNLFFNEICRHSLLGLWVACGLLQGDPTVGIWWRGPSSCKKAWGE